MGTKYKDSGIPWIGMIPSDWEVKRLKNLGYLYGGLTGKSGDDFNVDDESDCHYMLFIPFTNIFNNSVVNTEQLYKVKVDVGETQNLVQKNDLLFLMSSEDFDGVGKPAIIEEQIDNLSLNSFCKGFHITNSDVCAKYLFYHISSHIIRELIRQEAKGFIRINLRQDKLACIPLLLPPLPTQHRIADFLDRKCAEIDELAALQETMIAELKRYKQSVITEAVTKGLDPDVPMKDSGVEWIGEIPEGWEVIPFKQMYNLGKGLSITKADLVEKGVPVISYGQIHSKNNTGTTIKDELIRYVPTSFLENSKDALVKIGDIIFADTSEDLEGCGNCIYVDRDMTLFAGYHTIIASYRGDFSSRYLPYLFKTDCWRLQIRSVVNGVKLFSVPQKTLAATSIILPPFTEQRAIADYLDKKCAEIDELIAIKQQKIEALKEYKKSVIFEYVTGKKEVEK